MAHKKHKSQYISFLIIPDSQNEPRTFKFKRSVVTVFIVILIGIFSLILFGAASYWKVADIALDYSRLREENFKLRKSMEKINKLQTDLNQMKQIDQKIRASLNGYVSVVQSESIDSSAISDINFKQMSVEQERTIFNSVPSYNPVDGYITRGFDAYSFFTDPHLGIDVAAPTGTPIKAAADGIVMFSGWTDDGGNVLIIKHEYGFSTVYKHNEYNMVSVLEKVTKGQVIALLGNTGKITSGAHLHFEVWKNDSPVDPLLYISENNSKI